MKELHLDSYYRGRHELFYLENGDVEDSRLKNWRQVNWPRVIKIEADILGHVHSVDCKHPGFKFFMNFRWGGQIMHWDKGKKKYYPEKIHLWTIGWTDGKFCYLKDIDFFTGALKKRYVSSLKEFKQHIHPLCLGMVRG